MSYAGSVPIVLVGDEQISLNSVSFVATPGGPSELPGSDDDDTSTDA